MQHFVPIYPSWSLLFPSIRHGLYSHLSTMVFIPIYPSWSLFPSIRHGLNSHLSVMVFIPIHPSWSQFPSIRHGLYSHPSVMVFIPIYLSWSLSIRFLWSKVSFNADTTRATTNSPVWQSVLVLGSWSVHVLMGGISNGTELWCPVIERGHTLKCVKNHSIIWHFFSNPIERQFGGASLYCGCLLFGDTHGVFYNHLNSLPASSLSLELYKYPVCCNSVT
jgi:hypothetical protein